MTRWMYEQHHGALFLAKFLPRLLASSRSSFVLALAARMKPFASPRRLSLGRVFQEEFALALFLSSGRRKR